MLTPKEERFCQIRSSNTDLTQQQAYVAAGYPESKSSKKLACELEAKLHIKKRIMDLRDLAAMEGLWSRKRSIDALKYIVERELQISDNNSNFFIGCSIFLYFNTLSFFIKQLAISFLLDNNKRTF